MKLLMIVEDDYNKIRIEEHIEQAELAACESIPFHVHDILVAMAARVERRMEKTL